MEKSILQGHSPCCGPTQAGPDPLPSLMAEAGGSGSLLVNRPVTKQDPDPQPFSPHEVREKAIEHIKLGAPFVMCFYLGPGKTHLVMDGVDSVGAIGLLEVALCQLKAGIKG